MYKRTKQENELLNLTARAIIYGSGRNSKCPKCNEEGRLGFYKEGGWGCYGVWFIHPDKKRCRVTHLSLRKWFGGDLPSVSLVVRLLQNLRNDAYTDKVLNWAEDTNKPVPVDMILEAHQRRIKNHLHSPAGTIQFRIHDDREAYGPVALTVNDRERRDRFDRYRRNQ